MEVLKDHMEQVDKLQKAKNVYEPAFIMFTILQNVSIHLFPVFQQ